MKVFWWELVSCERSRFERAARVPVTRRRAERSVNLATRHSWKLVIFTILLKPSILPIKTGIYVVLHILVRDCRVGEIFHVRMPHLLTKWTFHGHTSPTHIATQGHSGHTAPHTTLMSSLMPFGRPIVPLQNRAGRFTDTQKYGRTTEFRSRKSTGRFIRPARSGAAPGAGGGRPTHRPRFSSARRAVITAIWPLLTSSLKFFVDFYF